MKISITVLPHAYSIVRLSATNPIPNWALSCASDELTSITRAGNELSIVCASNHVPRDCATRSDGWRALRFDGPFDLNLTGILESVLSPLAEAGVSVLALGTYDTDIVLVRDVQLGRAIESLRLAGHVVSA